MSLKYWLDEFISWFFEWVWSLLHLLLNWEDALTCLNLWSYEDADTLKS